jgi:L-fucose mutarotase/ribose pyranase (RbsD/FucU family)
MLKSLSPLLSPDLQLVLASMGHGNIILKKGLVPL